MKTHREKWRIRFTGGDIILALFATNVGIDREAQTSRISPDSDRSPRVVDDFQLSRRGTRREKREKRMEGSVHAAHTRALLLFTGIGARVRAGIIAPVVRCLSFVIVRGPFVVNAREPLVHMVIRRGGRVTSNVHARAYDYDTLTRLQHFPECVSRMARRRENLSRVCGPGDERRLARGPME